MQKDSQDTSILSRGWIYLIILAIVTIAFACIFVYITVYDSHDTMLLFYCALIYAVFILYLIIVTILYYLKVRKPKENMSEVQKLRSSISDAFYRPKY